MLPIVLYPGRPRRGAFAAAAYRSLRVFSWLIVVDRRPTSVLTSRRMSWLCRCCSS
jgi:hypothetical protein